MRPLWEEQDWNEEPEGEEQGEIQNMSCLREETEGGSQDKREITRLVVRLE